ncbi:MAG TPA: ATP-dependent DNA helicase UvrD2 [Frankiaceae bacterium]|nr:ATP-dependent DNA helicase UvrD2 [Frankiaceae bacterium]
MAALDDLDPEQRAVVEAPVGPVCVLAGAGTGKTRAITRRIAHLVTSGTVPAGQVLAVTFTARAAGELRSRLRSLGAEGVQGRTFHAAALRQLGYFWPQAIGGRMPQLVQSKAALVAGAGRRMRTTLSGPTLRDVTAEVEWAKSTMQTPESYPAAAAKALREPPLDLEAIARIYGAYEDVKRESGVLDFEDLLLLTAGLIEGHRFVADELRSRYRHFVVDEYQDVNPLQQRLLDAWLGDRDSLCVVGDPDQTIYSFTGASARYLSEFPTRFEGTEIVRLVRNYRSSPQVVGLANKVVGAGKLEAQAPAGPDVAFTECASEAEEAAAVADRIVALRAAGTPASEVAVLYRINAQSEAYEQALAGAGIPYVLRGGERFFERPEVREAVVLLRGAARAVDDPNDAVETLPSAVAQVLATTGWRADKPPAGTGAARERWENLTALVRLAETAATERPQETLAGFVADLAERAAAQHAPTVEGVTLASLHAAKGLEWDAVFLVGLVEGVLPISHAVTPTQVAEERRLFYVGVTRARRDLTLSWATAREAGRRPRPRSSFLDGLAPRAAALPSARSGSGRSKGKAPVAANDPVMYERLRTWRSEAAKELKQPAFCVFTDATLAAIADARPATEAALRKVPGVGASKLERFGADVLALLSE